MKKFIDDYDNEYEVYSDGRVYSHKSKKFLQPIRMNTGYLYVNLSHKGEFSHRFLHHLVATHFLGERPYGACIHHKDNNKENNHVSNLEYVTPQENTSKATEDNLMSYGENHHSSKLTTKEVEAIKKSSLSSRELGKQYSVSHVTILNIKNGKYRSRG